MGPMFRVAGAWAVATALIVFGVDAAIEQVARDVDVARPAPMTPSDVDAELRDQRVPTTTGATSGSDDVPQPTTGGARPTDPTPDEPTPDEPTPDGPATGGPTTDEPTSATPPGSRNTTAEPPRPGPTPASTRADGPERSTTTAQPGSPTDERDDTRRP